MDDKTTKRMPQSKKVLSESPVVLMPLYYWPVSDQTWKPLHDAIQAHPSITFLIIINPNSGPGGKPLPGADYVRETPKLNAYANVVTVGYIRINYCDKPIDEAKDEIDTYAGWAAIDSGLQLQGIMVDETPNHHTTHRGEYLDELYKHIKQEGNGFSGERLVIHNPGTPPDEKLATPGPDIIVTCEEPYPLYLGDKVQNRLKELHIDRQQSAYQISGIPMDKIEEVTRELCRRGTWIFATDLVDDFYESFGESWSTFVSAMARFAAQMDTAKCEENPLPYR